ncbi:sensor kinase/phosphatase LuxQ [Seminavis robusta]|uniref:histidine kinase n=1 Tax=Seminavis robusta TaxID=568900 RepID=A0A9N8D7T2_9STRA|nr:sensor kinase/phosphatase LuxQ [Seminavis robusta]|eukprot:Sro29_g019310.1 sensor kinase/phosphatase LuxQ (1009) ;mRNA; f:149001-152336
MQASICTVLSIQLVLVLVIACGIFLCTFIIEQDSIAASVDHGEGAVNQCFDQYIETIQEVGESFITDISHQIKNHVEGVVDDAEGVARSAARAVEKTGFMEGMATNSFHGDRMLPSLGWMLLNPLEDIEDDVVEDVVIAGFNSTEEENNWVWFGTKSRIPNRAMDCDFYYYRNASNLSSSLWCIEDLYEEPDQPSPSIWPHLYSPAIVKLQEATPCVVPENATQRPLTWMPLNFFVWTANVVALTSVVGGVFGPDGTCEGLAAANVRFTSMNEYLTDLAGSARYANLSIALIESSSGTILGTSLGSAIYKENVTMPDGSINEAERAGNLSTMENPLANAVNEYIEESYGSIGQVPAPLIVSATLEGADYFISFETFSRPDLNLTILAFLPQLSITGPAEAQRFNTQLVLEESAKELEDERDLRLIVVLLIGVGGLFVAASVAGCTAAYLSMRIQALVDFMEKLRSLISEMADKEMSRSSTENLTQPLPADFFPVFETTRLNDLNHIRDATKDLCAQLLETWNNKQEVFRQALEQRQFTASIAHDIRNPLHGVLGIVGMMQSNIEEHKDKLPLLAETLKHMGILLNDMVDLSKIQGGKVTNVKKKFDVWASLQEVNTLYQDKVESGGGKLSCADRFSLPEAYSDPVHVQRILTNYVSNASKYAAGCEIMLKAMLVTREQVQSLSFLDQFDSYFGAEASHWAKCGTLEDDQYIVLACLDRGRGIPYSKLPTVFDAYSQTRDDDRSRGAGLGLAIVKGLAVEMGGGVGVYSEADRGSLFWMVVTCDQNPPPPPLPSPPALFPLFSLDQQSEKSCLSTPILPLDQKSDVKPLFSLVDKKSEVKPLFSLDALPPKKDPGFDVDAPSKDLPSSSVDTDDVEDTNYVLVVDDTKLNLMLLKHFLTKLNIKAETVMSGMEGLDKLRQDPKKFSLILSDFNMPEMSGGEMCLEVRNDHRLCNLPFICSSGNVITKDEMETYQMDETLMKPFTAEKLKETIGPFMGHISKWSPSCAEA